MFDIENIDSSVNYEEILLVEDKIISENVLSKHNNMNIIPIGDINEDDYILRNNKNPSKDGKNSADLNSALSTQTDHFKFYPTHCIIEPSVDPSEWKKELDKVCKLLVIPENVEYIYNSQSEDNLKSNINFDDLNSDYYIRARTFSLLTQYFGKTENSQELSNCITFSSYLDNQIDLINLQETKLTKSLGIKLGGFNQKGLIKLEIEKQIEETNNKCQKMDKYLHDLEDRIEMRTVYFCNKSEKT